MSELDQSQFCFKPHKIGINVKSYIIFSSLEAARTTIFSDTYIRNRVKNRLCPICVKALTNIKENFKKFQ